MNLDTSITANRGFCQTLITEWQTSVDPDETALAVSSGSTLFLQVYLIWSAGIKRLNNKKIHKQTKSV